MDRRRAFFFVRVGILLTVLFGVVLYAVRDLRSRRARNDWSSTLDVAVVVVRDDPARAPEDAAVARFEERLPALEARLAAESTRYGGTARPFRFRFFGPTTVTRPPPVPAGDGLVELVSYALDLRRWVSDVDPAAGVDAARFDSRIYVVARRPASHERSMFEGRSEQGGRVGIVDVELADDMPDLALFVVAHELFHTLGAEDTYDATGRARIPEGLAEPDRSPRFPQSLVEIMARGRPLAGGDEALPASVDELAIGPSTARGVGLAR